MSGLSNFDDVAARAQQNATGLISEVAYPRVVSVATAHALRARPVAGLQPWVCVGPRNIGGRFISLVQDPTRPQVLYAGSAHGGLWRTADAGDTWRHLGGTAFNVPVGALAIHASRPQVVYVGTGSVGAGQASGDGLHRVTMRADGGADFERLALPPPPGEAPNVAANGAAARYTRIEVDPDNAERFWVASQTGLWRCRVGVAVAAAAWVRDFPPAAAAPEGTPALATRPVFGITADFPNYATDLRIARDPRSSETTAEDGVQRARFLVIHLAVAEAGVFRGRYDRSTDSVTWDARRSLVPVAPNINAFGRVLLALCRHRPEHLYAVHADENDQAAEVQASADNGDHWERRGRIAGTDNRQANYSMVLEVNPDDPTVVVCGTLNLFVSTDGGRNFSAILEWTNYRRGEHAQHEDQHVALFDTADRRRLWACNDGGIAVARDLARPDPALPGYWRKRSHGIVAGQFQDVALHPLAALSFMTAGGLQDNGSWFGCGGPSWFHCGHADGGEIAIHAAEPRQFIMARNGGVNLGTVSGPLPTDVGAVALPPNTDPLTQIATIQTPVMQSPLLVDLALADPWMRVRIDDYLPPTPLRQQNLAGPFVGLLRQDPRAANAGSALFGWTVGDSDDGDLNRTCAVLLNRPAAPALLPAAPGTLPVPPFGINQLFDPTFPPPPFVSLLNRLAMPAPPALETGEEASAIAFGPDTGAPLVEGWIGTTRGRLIRTNDAPFGGAPNPWVNVPALPLPGGLRYAANRITIHPTHPEIVAVAATQVDRLFAVIITTAGAPGVAQFQAQFLNNRVLEGVLTPAAAAPLAFTPLAGTSLFVSFPDPAYDVNNTWQVTVDGQVIPFFRIFTFGTLANEARIRITAAGVAGASFYTVEFRAGAAFGPASGAIRTHANFQRMLASTLMLRFDAGINFLVDTVWIIGVDGRVRPGTDLRVLPTQGRLVTVTIAVGGAVGAGGATFRFEVDGLPAQGPFPTGPAVELGTTGVVLHFAGGPFVAGHRWRVEIDNRVVPVAPPVAGTVELLARLTGRVFLTHNRGAAWADVSFPRARPAAAFDADTDSLPPGPVSSLAFEVNAGVTDLYAGTLAGVYRAAAIPLVAPVLPAVVPALWRPFGGTAGQELPLTLVNDIEIVPGTRRLRVATFGRGLWDCDVAGALPRRQIVIRQTVIEEGLAYPRAIPAALRDDPRLPAGQVWLDHTHAFDIRVDSAPFKFFDDVVDGVEFDEQIGVDTLVPLASQAVYVQVHNRGWDTVRNVDVFLLFAVSPPAPLITGGAGPPGALMPAGLPAPETALAAPGFAPAAPSPWRRIGTARRIAELRPWEPVVIRFDWKPPASLAPNPANDWAALLAIATSADDPLPDPHPDRASMLAFIAAERRAALRVVPVQPLAGARLFVRDGIDDDIRLGAVAFAGRSPDIIVVATEPATPATAFADPLDTRPKDSVRLGATNHVYVRVTNTGLTAAEADLRLWSVVLDAQQQPRFLPANWDAIVPVAGPFPKVNVPAGGNALIHVAWANPTHPDASGLRTLALLALIRSTDDTDPVPDVARIDTLDKFWAFFGSFFDSDNAALRVLRVAS